MTPKATESRPPVNVAQRKDEGSKRIAPRRGGEREQKHRNRSESDSRKRGRKSQKQERAGGDRIRHRGIDGQMSSTGRCETTGVGRRGGKRRLGGYSR